MAKKNNDDESAGKPKKQAVTPDVKRVAKPKEASSTASRKPAERKPVKSRSSGFVVRGQVLQGGKPCPGALVRAVDQDRRGENPLGDATTDQDGKYQITYSESKFRRTEKEIGGPDLIVRVYSAEGKVMTQSKRKRNAGREETVNLMVDSEQPYTVSGTVRRGDGRPAAGALVRAYDQDLRKKQLLGKATTDAAGHYSISYTSRKFLRAEKDRADLRVTVVNAKGKELVSSELLFNAPVEAIIDLALPLDGKTLSEFELLIEDILPLLAGQGKGGADLKIAELEEKEIAFLSRETGQDRQHIVWLAQAANLAREASSPQETARAIQTQAKMPAPQARSIPMEVFYGCFRQGLPTELSALWATPTDALIKTLRAAIEQRIVPLSMSASLDGISVRIEQIKLALELQAPASGAAASLGELLATLPAPLNLNQQHAIAAAVTDLSPDDPQLVERIAGISGFDRDAAVGVARTLRLGALTGGHLPLTQALQPRLAKESEGTLRPLAALRPDEWLDLVYTHGTPDGIMITPVAYADALAASVERQYPTAALAAHFTDGRRLAQHPAFTEVGPFLRNNPAFDIVTANLNAVSEQVLLGGIPEPQSQQLVAGLLALQRMNVLGASWDETATLLENDLHSPHQLLAAGPGQLTALLEGQIAPERVMALYLQAEELHNVTFAAFTAAFSPFSAPQILSNNQFGTSAGPDPINPGDFGDPAGSPTRSNPVFVPHTDGSDGPVKLSGLAEAVAHQMANRSRALDPAWGRVPPPVRTGPILDNTPQLAWGASINHQPTLQTLFGSQDACACGHCNSVLSPAAYFVDVLQFIKDAKLDWLLLGLPPEFPGRRPDLQDIELSCENTNTEVPAIDLVLEILENAVALPLPVDLEPGTKIEDELISGHKVGPAVRTALEKTVRSLPADVYATLDAGDWTVVDGHRRWRLTAQNEDALKAIPMTGMTKPLITTGLDLPVVIAALDQGLVPSGAEAAFVELFIHRSFDISNHKVTITKLETGKSWRVEYQFVAQIRIDLNAPQLVMETPTGVRWWRTNTPSTIAAVEKELAAGAFPMLVRKQLELRFYNTLMTIAPAGDNIWVIASAKRELTLNFTPAQVTITSLAYQSGDPDADPLAWPENHNPEAYVQLKGEGAVFPWSLPVDLPLEEVRLFLERARSSRLRLIELMLPVDPPLRDDATVNTVPAMQSMPEDTPLVFSRANKNAITVDGRSEDTLTITVSVTNGELKVRVHPEASVRNNGTESVTIRGSAAAVNGALDGMAFNPTADYNGAALLTISTTQGTVTHVNRLELTITPVADIASDTAATEEDYAVTIPVLANDSFENSGRRITAVNGLPITAGGPAVAVARGKVALDVSGQLIFTPTPGYNGHASFTYTVTSGGVTETATVYVNLNSANFALEVLGLSRAEAALIGAEKTGPAVYDYWGVSSDQKIIWDAASGGFLKGTSPLVLLQNVSILLQQSRLGFEELQAMLATQFVTQGGTAALIIEPQTTCKPSEMTLPDLTPGHLDRIHRFTRLWRRLGWTMRELDLAIQAFGDQLQPHTLFSLARLQRLKQQLKLPVASLVGSLDLLETRPWTDYLTDGAPVQLSLYTTIFQREVVRSLSDFADFALQSDGKELKNTPNLGISAHADYIGACLRIKSSDVAGWVSGTHGLGIEDKLNLANLSRLTAAASLCHALSIDPEKLTHHLNLYGTLASPFQPGMSAHERAGAMLEYVKRYQFVKQSGVDVETLRYLLQHNETAGSNVTLSVAQRKQLAGAAREAVHSIPDAPEETPLTASADPARVAARLARQDAARLATRLAREDAAIAALATGLGAARELVDDLLRTRLRYPSDTSKPAVDAFLETSFLNSDVSQLPGDVVQSVLVRLHKAVFLFDAFKLDPSDLRLLRPTLPLLPPETDANGFTALDFNTLPVAFSATPTSIVGFEQLLALAHLRKIASGAGDLLHKYAALNLADNNATAPDDAQQVLADGLLLDVSDVNKAALQLGITTADQYRDPIALTRLIELLAALKQLGAKVDQAIDLTAPSPDDAAALSARELLRSKYGESQWHDLIKPIADKLRERQRDALVDYLIARDSLPRDGDANPQIFTGDRMRDANDLYERYLIDVETGSCLKTTRLLLATAAAQLFIQRVLLNLEPALAQLTDDKRKLWDWMHSYRVWEANRKVFLFPENWLLPELRDDKTAIFREMEGALTEKEPSPEITRAALLGYLDELGDLAQISVIAMYQDRRIVGNHKVEHTLYIIGRTPDQPYHYFWRSCAEFGDTKKMSWSGWEALDLDNANDFIMPFVFDGDLHLAWPIFRETKAEKKPDGQDKLLWEVQVAWTRRTNKGWVKRKIGKAQPIKVERLPNKDASTSFAFRFGKKVLPVPGSNILEREKINIDCYAAAEVTPHTSLEPDPSLMLDTTPVGYLSVPADQWNVNCEVKGVVYRYVTSDKEGDKFYRGWDGVTVVLEAKRHDHDNKFNDIFNLNLSRTTGTNGKGEFNFNFTTTVFGKNGGLDTENSTSWGIINAAHIVLTFFGIPGHDPIVKTADLIKNGSEHYFHWTWEINVGFEDKELANQFLADRAVNYQTVGAFIFETGKDLRHDPSPGPMPLPGPVPNLVLPPFYTTVDMSVDGNRFFAKETAPSIESIAFGAEDGTLLPSPTINFPVFVTRATQGEAPGSPAEPHVWYLQDNYGSFYLQKREGIWHRWPDGEPFASSYRIAATPSSSALFRPENESLLHIDPDANNFGRKLPYANYNWELFLHAPLAIADYLASQQRFEDARRWLHAVFDPTTVDKITKIPQYWRFLEFHNDAKPDSIAQMLTWLADPKMVDPKDKQAIEDDLTTQIDEWKKNPFMPHVIARLRPSAYQWYTFFAYLEVLIGWGDQLFRRDTRESVNDATLLYVLAAKLLGPRPRVIPAPTPPLPLTYRLLPKDTEGHLDGFSNAWVKYADLPGFKQLASAQTGSSRSSQSFALQKSDQPSDHIPIPIPDKSSGIPTLTSLIALAFCIPQNEKVTEFYDRVEDRLFKVRNCRNIEGVFRDLPLYEPPIDPLLLIRARAAGLDIDSVVAELYAPLPNHRFTFTLPKALELTAELKALGSALLTTYEKQDAEELTLLRSRHEIAMLKLVRDTRTQQIAEAEANIAALQQSEETILERFSQYQKLLGKPGVTKGQDGLPVVEQSSSLAVSTDPVGGTSGLGLIRREIDQLILSAVAHGFTQEANGANILAGIFNLIPNITAGSPFAGQTFGGSNMGAATSALAKAIEMGAAEANYLANLAGTFGGYERRQDEWVHQSKLALAEMKQIEKQIIAAEIRKDIAERELSNHDTQIENAQEVEDFMRSKFTNQQLYRWMSSKIAEVYFRTYQLALDQAKRAERAYQFELGLDGTTAPFVQAGNWDSLKGGLLAGEHLHHDLKRMESAYLERNVREFELTKHISLAMLDPLALLMLRETGRCTVKLPEEIFDLDYPGHYFRRIKSVSLTLPCVVGPYTTISCTLRLLKNSIRINTANGNDGGYPRNTDNGLPAYDGRFVENNIPVKAIAASGAQNDSGMFELSFRDERYLPFEGAGAVSEWALELFNDQSLPDFGKSLRQFDYKTISDAILHVKYTAREDAGVFKNGAITNLEDYFRQGATPSLRMFNLRQEFPTQWQQFIQPATPSGVQELKLNLQSDLFPYYVRNRTVQVKDVYLFAEMKKENQDPYTVKIKPPLPEPSPSSPPATETTLTLSRTGIYGDLHSVEYHAPGTQRGNLGNWTIKVQKQNASDFTSLEPDEIKNLVMVISFETASS